MSTLDQAFIRAYQKQRVIPAPHIAFPACAAETLAGPAATSPPAPVCVDLPRQPEPEISAPPSLIVPSPLIAPPSLKAPSPRPASVRAALEVEQFDWPETVEALRLSSAASFAAWGEQFSAERGVTLAVVSNARGAGRTTVLLAAARQLSLARPGASLVLVDADFRRPHLALHLGVAVEFGWEDVLTAELPLAEAMVESAADRQTLLPLRAGADDVWLSAYGAQLAASLRTLQDSFDFVCIDAGPLEEMFEAFQAAGICGESRIDAALVVRDMRNAAGEDNSEIGRRLTQLGVRHWDLVENFVQG